MSFQIRYIILFSKRLTRNNYPLTHEQLQEDDSRKSKQINLFLDFDQILDTPNENKYFQHPCLNPLSGKCTADEYFKEISYQIDLQEVMPQKVRDSFNGCKYLLQVWDKQQHISYDNGILTEASDNLLQAITLNEEIFDDTYTIIDASKQKIRMIQTEIKIQALLVHQSTIGKDYSLICFETDDAILDFNKIFFKNLDSDDDTLFSYSFEQLSEITPRRTFTNDPIIKMCMIFSNGYNYSVAQRASGGIDLYWNFILKESIQDRLASDIAMTISSIYFKMKDGLYLYIDHNNHQNISFGSAIEISNDMLNFEIIHFEEEIFALYSFEISKNLDGKNDSEVEEQEEQNSLQIIEIDQTNDQRNESSISEKENQDEDSSEPTYSDYQIILKNGDIHQKILDICEQNDVISSDRCKIRLQGKVLRVTEDLEEFRYLFVVIKQENQDICLKQVRDNIAYDNGKKISLYELQDDEGEGQSQQKLLHQFNEAETVSGMIHTASSYELEDHLILMDDVNIFVLDFKTSIKIRVIQFASKILDQKIQDQECLIWKLQQAMNDCLLLYSKIYWLEQESALIIMLIKRDQVPHNRSLLL
ncbi:UNKNOWN [Stylonychia lemnae]|uniref:Uncharacterized protein n=1 Tax=Stylonychia lemnae TaxID=5949 RepID=A0A077ZYF8_STYLE|nr:UNKNOWN [Stylonychia lemnae]|eukprot:CDW74971.1 UNKNOWN [Stylonychia lemnae]